MSECVRPVSAVPLRLRERVGRVWVPVCQGVRTVPGVYAWGRLVATPPWGPDPSLHTPGLPALQTPQTMNGVLLGVILPPVNWSGLSGLRPLHHHGLPTSLPLPPPQGWPWNPDNAVTTKTGKAVNSFPTGFGHCTRPPTASPGPYLHHKPQEASGLQALQDCPCLPRPLSSPWKKEGRRLGLVEQHQGRAFPTLLPPQALSSRPLPRIAQGQAGAGHPFRTHHWLTRWGN